MITTYRLMLFLFLFGKCLNSYIGLVMLLWFKYYDVLAVNRGIRRLEFEFGMRFLMMETTRSDHSWCMLLIHVVGKI